MEIQEPSRSQEQEAEALARMYTSVEVFPIAAGQPVMVVRCPERSGDVVFVIDVHGRKVRA